MNTLANVLQQNALDWIIPDWPAPARVQALMTTRNGLAGAAMDVSTRHWDAAETVAGRALLEQFVFGRILWLDQVHGRSIFRPEAAVRTEAPLPQADACVLETPGLVAAVQTADCLPVLLCRRDGAAVAAAHAGWRGLAAGVLEATVAEMAAPEGELMAWLGAAIGPEAFEVGDEVRDAFCASDADASACFRARGGGKWSADLYALARRRLARAGVAEVFGGSGCTLTEPERFYSFRRGGETGRMATLIWLET